jgi:hypothetical protein
MDIIRLFCEIDDFCLVFEPVFKRKMLVDKPRLRNRPSMLSLSEVMTIIVLFHVAGYRHFKQFYLEKVCQELTEEFPNLPSYNRFVELQAQAMLPLWAYLWTRRGQCSGISFIDSTKLAVCHNRRILSHRVFAEVAERGKTSVDWFYGFKLHLVINDEGELLRIHFSKGNVDDRQPVPRMMKDLWGLLYGDKGYLSEELMKMLKIEQGIELITKLKKNMKQKFISLFDKLMLRKRAIMETVIDQLKNISQIEHTRHRSLANFLGNLAGGLIAYTYREKKPSLNLRVKQLTGLQEIVL